MLSAAVIRELVMAGLSGESLVAACERIEAASLPPASQRTANAERQARFRQRKKDMESVTDVTSNVTVTDEVLSPTPPISYQTPIQKTPLKGVKKVSPKEPKAKRASRIPEGFDPGSAGLDYAESQGLTLDDVLVEQEKFRDYHASKGSLMLDWDAAWRTWVRNAVEFRARAGPKALPPRQAPFYRS